MVRKVAASPRSLWLLFFLNLNDIPSQDKSKNKKIKHDKNKKKPVGKRDFFQNRKIVFGD